MTSTKPVALWIGCGGDQSALALLPSLVACEDKNQCLRADVQHRVIPAALRWVDADSAVEGHEALAKLLKGRTGHAPGRHSRVLAGQLA